MIRAVVVVLAANAAGACLIAPAQLCDGAYDFDHTTTLPPEINEPGMMNDAPFLTRDRMELYFTRNTGSGASVFYSHRDTPTGAWAPAVMLPFAQSQNASNPYVTADRSTLYFTNAPANILNKLARTTSTGEFDGTPETVDRPTHVGSMSMTDDQLDIYYEDPSSGTKTIFHAHRPSADVDFPATGTSVAGLGALAQAASPGISSDGKVMLVASFPDDFLYRANGSGDTFTLDPAPIEPMPVNTYDGSLTDDTIMIYARGAAEIVTVERACNN